MDKPWLIVQYDNRHIQDEYVRLIDLNKQYCKRHDYEYMLETTPYDMPPWWIKVKLVRDLLHTNRYKGVLWLDTDAVIHNHALPIEKLLIQGKSFYYCADCPVWTSEFNAGVWLVTNDTMGNTIMDTWINSYSPNDWTKKDNKWTSSGAWAGSTYEQGAFVKYVKPLFETSIYIYPWQVFQSYEPENDTFSLHFAGELSETYLPKYNAHLYYPKLILYIILCVFSLVSIVIVLYIVDSTYFHMIFSGRSYVRPTRLR